MIAAYQDITELTAPMLNELISYIEIGQFQKVDGVTRRTIRIRYRQFAYVELFNENRKPVSEQMIDEYATAK
jgi:hypothetical protein